MYKYVVKYRDIAYMAWMKIDFSIWIYNWKMEYSYLSLDDRMKLEVDYLAAWHVYLLIVNHLRNCKYRLFFKY